MVLFGRRRLSCQTLFLFLAGVAPLLTTLFFGVVSAAQDTPSARKHAAHMAGINWNDFNFSLNGVKTDAMWLQKFAVPADSNSEDESSSTASFSLIPSSNEDAYLQPFGELQVSPAATVLNYGQGLFEGLKAFRRTDGSIALFRPTANALRMAQGARRFCLPIVPIETFTRAVHAVVRANARWIPPAGKGALYLRPLLFGSGAGLGVKPSTEATFVVYGSPVGNYFPGGRLSTIRLQIIQGYSRAAPGGSGSVKAIGNYAPAFVAQKQVRQRGFSEVLCTDAAEGDMLEEAGASNLFLVYPNRTLITPPLDTGTILPGITRQSVIELARRECGCTVIERPIRLSSSDLADACEAFCCGTGAVITAVSCISLFDGEKEIACHTFGNNNDTPKDGESQEGKDEPEVGTFTRQLHSLLTGIQSGSCDPQVAERYKDWIDIVQP